MVGIQKQTGLYLSLAPGKISLYLEVTVVINTFGGHTLARILLSVGIILG